MAQTRKRRSTKHRGNAVGMIEARGRTGRRPDERETKGTGRAPRSAKPPEWRSAINRAALSAVVLLALLVLLFDQSVGAGFGLAVVAFVIYVPISYLTDSHIYKRRQGKADG